MANLSFNQNGMLNKRAPGLTPPTKPIGAPMKPDIAAMAPGDGLQKPIGTVMPYPPGKPQLGPATGRPPGDFGGGPMIPMPNGTAPAGPGEGGMWRNMMGGSPQMPSAFGDGSDWDRPNRGMPNQGQMQALQGLFGGGAPSFGGFQGAPMGGGTSMPAPAPQGGMTATAPNLMRRRPMLEPGLR